MPREGEVLAGKYQLELFLGAGGFASVWQARHLVVGRRVAVKILSDVCARDPAHVSRFVREAQLAAQEIHESIVRVEDVDHTDDGAPFLVMELLEGVSLRDYLTEQGALDEVGATAIIRAVAEGVGAAHQAGIVHRDLKPENVFISSNPREGRPWVKILDFGLGKDTSSQEKVTATGELMGTLDYLAPEVFLGAQFKESGTRTDVFALGVMLYELLTGRHPLEELGVADSATEQFVLYANRYRAKKPLPLPRQLRPELPGWVDEVAAAAMALDPNQRIPDGAAFARLLTPSPARQAVPVSPGLQEREAHAVPASPGLQAPVPVSPGLQEREAPGQGRRSFQSTALVVIALGMTAVSAASFGLSYASSGRGSVPTRIITAPLAPLLPAAAPIAQHADGGADAQSRGADADGPHDAAPEADGAASLSNQAEKAPPARREKQQNGGGAGTSPFDSIGRDPHKGGNATESPFDHIMRKNR